MDARYRLATEISKRRELIALLEERLKDAKMALAVCEDEWEEEKMEAQW